MTDRPPHPTVSRRGVDRNGIVRAAGGVVVRPGAGGRPEVLVVHRPKYADWSFPKGKLDPGESEAEAALREVAEETGYVCALGAELGTVSYEDPRGRPKTVRYWRMDVVRGSFRPNHEVDQVRWLTPDAAVDRLSYERDREILAWALANPG